MAEPRTEAAFEAHLRDLLTAELRAAEADYPSLPRRVARSTDRSLPVGLLVALVLMSGALLLLPRLLGSLPLGPGGPALGPDGLPTSIDDEPVLRGSAITSHLDTSGSFLAGGYLVLASTPCPSPAISSSSSVGPASDCAETWLLAADAKAAGQTFRLGGITAAPGFVRTSGAPTVVRVVAAPAPAGSYAADLAVEAVVWRLPTKGPIPPAAVPAQGGQTNDALVPDFVAASAQDGVTIAGYVPKGDLLGGPALLPGTLQNPPQPSPIPVYAEDLSTLVGHMVPDRGFVPLTPSTP